MAELREGDRIVGCPICGRTDIETVEQRDALEHGGYFCDSGHRPVLKRPMVFEPDGASPPPDRLTDLEHEATRAAFHLREATGLIDTDDVAAWKHVQMAYDRLRLADREPEKP